MKLSSGAKRGALALSTLALAATSSVTGGVLAAAHADGGATEHLTLTDYGYEGTAYGTRVLSNMTGISSGRSTFSYISCTLNAGHEKHRDLASVSVPTDSPFVTVKSATSANKTFKDTANDIAGGITSTNTIGEVQLGNLGTTPVFTLNGLKTTSTAWATNSGELKSLNQLSSVKIDLVDLPSDIPPELQGPLDDLLGAINGGIGDVISAIQDNGGSIEIPSFGRISTGFDHTAVHPKWAGASAYALQVLLYGPDMVKDASDQEVKDDTLIGVGRSWARINRDLPAGVMVGAGWGAESSGLGGVFTSSRTAEQPLPCGGTEADTFKTKIANVEIPGADDVLALAGLGGRSFGIQKANGAAKAWTSGSVTDVTFGPLQLKGISGVANVRQLKSGKVVKSIDGTTIGEIIVNGESYGGFDPATVGDIPTLEIPGLGSLKFFVTEETARGLKVSTVQLVVAPGTPGETVVSLGNAQAFIKRQ